MRRIEPALVFLVFVIVLAGCRQEPLTAQVAVRKIIDGHGTVQALRDVHGYLFNGRIQTVAQENPGKVWILYRRPAQLRVIVDLDDSREDRLYLDGRGWRDTGAGFIEEAGPTLAVMAFQAEHLDLPYRLLQGRYDARLAEEVTPDEPVRLVLSDADGTETKISVDPARWVIRTVEREFEINGQKLTMGVVYEEYRTIKGVQLPFRILNYVNGQPVGRTDFESVQANPPLPDSVFSAPGRGEKKDSAKI